MIILKQRTLLVVLLSMVMGSLVGCGYQLRGSQHDYATASISQSAHAPIFLKIADTPTSKFVTRPLRQQLSLAGFTVSTDELSSKHSVIDIDNLYFKDFELVGVLTEVRVIISADVTYQIIKNGRVITHTQPMQIERSYQYNKASVSVNQEGSQVRKWLYNALATRITDQYIALVKDSNINK